jgi:hypothetical protein
MLRAVVVVFDDGLPQARINGLMLNMRDLPGVASVTDLNGIDRTTLDYLLLKPTWRVLAANRKDYNNLREYWRRKRQPRLEI